MNLNSVKNDLRWVLETHGLSQVKFAKIHGLSYSWINKFLNDVADNPRLNTLIDLQNAIAKQQAK
jgi:transcriptional regulator with XRE-family HTH domain